MFTVVDQLPWLGKRELICLLLFTYNYVVSVWRGLFFLRVLGIGYIILLWHSLSLPYNYFIFRMVHKTLFYHSYLSSSRFSKRFTIIHCIYFHPE